MGRVSGFEGNEKIDIGVIQRRKYTQKLFKSSSIQGHRGVCNIYLVGA